MRARSRSDNVQSAGRLIQVLAQLQRIQVASDLAASLNLTADSARTQILAEGSKLKGGVIVINCPGAWSGSLLSRNISYHKTVRLRACAPARGQLY